MEPVLARTKFCKPVYEAAARKILETGGGVLSHPVGMAVHDVGRYTDSMLKPGHVFSIDPQLWVPEKKLSIRSEDVVAITATGFENFTGFLPVALEEIERMVKGEGIAQKFPPS